MPPDDPSAQPLPDVVVIGAMKCGTTALHAYLDAHPDVAMAEPKELNFFNGPADRAGADPADAWRTGQWWRGLDWYSGQFDPAARVRGEASPAYTSPSFPEVPRRMASVVPDACLVYLVRDPLGRALSQFAHHRRDGAEPRGVEEAVLDPDSQYVARSRYAERLDPFLEHFDGAQVEVMVHERLLQDPARELSRLFAALGLDPQAAPAPGPGVRRPPPVEADRLRRLRRAMAELVSDDVARLRDLMEDPLEEWGPW